MPFMENPELMSLEHLMSRSPTYHHQEHRQENKIEYLNQINRLFRFEDCPPNALMCKKHKGVFAFPELLMKTWRPVTTACFRKRLEEYIKKLEETKMIYRGEQHKKNFLKVVELQKDANNETLVALFLLTADNVLWSRVRRNVSGGRINYHEVKLAGISTSAYALFSVAKDISTGSRHICIADLCDEHLIDRKLFGIICSAMTIAVYGNNAVLAAEQEEK